MKSSVETVLDEATIALEARNVTKVFPGTKALDRVDFEVRKGEVHGLCGGNGSGKSTLIKILSGVYHADGGTVKVSGASVDLTTEMTSENSRNLGIRVVHQDLAVFPDLSVMENIMIGAQFPTAAGRIKWKEARQRTLELIERFDILASPDDLLNKVPMSTRTQVAIARALQDLPSDGVVILDEPTASLPAHEVELLHESIRRLAAQGYAVILVSHRLDEILALTDRVTIFRDGQVMAKHATSELTEAELIEAIVGRRTERLSVATGTSVVIGEPVLKVSDLSAGPLSDINFEVRSGEMLGIAGLAGSGRTELLRAICGDLKRRSGSVTINGDPADFASLSEAFQSGLALIPESRHADAIFPDLSVDENLSVGVLDRFWRGFGFRERDLRDDNDLLRSRFGVKTPSGETLISALSGGNQQKAVLARWLRRSPDILLLDEPSQGVDVGARNDIYLAIRAALNKGGAAILVTSDLEELAQAADRVLVMTRGRLTAEVPGSELSAQRLNELIYMEEGVKTK